MEKKLGFGCMRLPLTDPKDQTSIDLDAFKSLIDLFIEKGYTYFDTAYPYHGGASERAVNTCLVKRYPRDSFTLATKLFMHAVECPGDPERLFSEQLEKCGVEYFDYYMLHALGEKSYSKAEQFNCFEFVSARKAAGQIRHIGFSFHGSPELLEQILTKHPEAEFVQLQINYLDWEDKNVQSRRCYEVARRFNKDIIIMEPCKGGELATAPDEAIELMRALRPNSTPASWAFRFAGSLEGVIMVLSGMNTREQILDNTAVFDSISPLTSEEKAVIDKTVKIIDESTAVKCTGCRYCEEGCPMSIPIPDIFSSYNRFVRTGMDSFKRRYADVTKDKGKASDCISCRACVEKCPQNLEIPEYLKDAAKIMEN